MADVVLFHHAQGRTSGVLALAEALRAAGHAVSVPDLYEGRTFDTLEAGMGHLRSVGSEQVRRRALAATADLPAEVVYAGISLGVMPAQELAQTRPGARAAVLVSASIPMGEFAGSWPEAVALQLHTKAGDEMGDVDVAEELHAAVDASELFTYPGDEHLFVDSSLPDHDGEATALLLSRVLDLLGRLDEQPGG